MVKQFLCIVHQQNTPAIDYLHQFIKFRKITLVKPNRIPPSRNWILHILAIITFYFINVAKVLVHQFFAICSAYGDFCKMIFWASNQLRLQSGARFLNLRLNLFWFQLKKVWFLGCFWFGRLVTQYRFWTPNLLESTLR